MKKFIKVFTFFSLAISMLLAVFCEVNLNSNKTVNAEAQTNIRRVKLNYNVFNFDVFTLSFTYDELLIEYRSENLFLFEGEAYNYRVTKILRMVVYILG